MFRLLLLTIVTHYSYANCGKHLPGQVYAPCPPKVQPPVVYAAPPPPPPPVILKPLLLPELPASHEFLRQSHRHRRSRHRYRSSSESPEYRNRRRGRKSCDESRCRNLVYICAPNTNCTAPNVKYINDNSSCKRAIVTCYPLSIAQTPDLKILSNGVAIDNMLTCDKWGRWIAKDNQNQKIEVNAVGCYAPAAEAETTTTSVETTA
ncbi:unnamed protein product [Cylicocyclus nassatus]|uniref:Uncharacterized protein n=1 Tax=Cylicocyclus nassatus TaxID=53992 RepID=A0AA36HDF5_CYLNA|nr:unnamed protein product [Cylicocyclus nassatus]